MLNLCGIVVAILRMATGRIFFMSGINSGHHNLPTNEMALKSYNVEFVCGIVVAILKMATGRNFSMSESIRGIIIYPLMVTYHYVKFYVSIIIHLEVININVRNFNFPIGFYSNPHPL